MLLDHREQLYSRPDLLHLGLEGLPARLFLFPFESQRGEGRLLYGGSAVYDLSNLPALNRYSQKLPKLWAKKLRTPSNLNMVPDHI